MTLPGTDSRTFDIGHETITLETGAIARQADGSIIIRQGNAAVLVTAVTADSPREGIDFFPLTVDYRELFGAAGSIPRSYNRREGRLSDKEILSSRIIDRTIRPLFPEGYRHETQVIATLLSADQDVDTDVLGLLGTCAAIHLSPIPFNGPAAGFRICKVDGELLINPRRSQRAAATLDLIISGGRPGLVMMEGHCQNVPESDIIKAMEVTHEKIVVFLDAIDDWRREIGVVSREFNAEELPLEILSDTENRVGDDLRKALSLTVKQQRYSAIDAAKTTLLEGIQNDDSIDHSKYLEAFNRLKSTIVRERIFSDSIRLDNRSPYEVRPITGQVNWIPTPHGSAVFTRGETQACVTCTLGSDKDILKLQTVYGDDENSFFLHYSFPPYSVGEVRPMRGPGRREVGHGTLAWRALSYTIPDQENFPYTIRVFSEITESNGSSSMATVCGGCMALMDAGVPIREMVAGVAMGLIAENGKYVVLTDILGDEDHLGDMDFKVAGTASGVTAIQMDNKIGNLPADVLASALAQARDGLNHILGKMSELSPQTRIEPKPHAPRSESFYIREHKIGLIIGPGGKTIKDIQARTGTTISINDEGCVQIYAVGSDALHSARREIEFMVREPKLNGYYRGTVKSIKPFGMFVEILPNTEGLVHVTELDDGFVKDPAQIARVGDVIPVKVLGVDNGKLKLSRKAALGISSAHFEE